MQILSDYTQKAYINTCSLYLDIRSLLPASRGSLHLLQLLELFGLLLVLLRKKLGGQQDWQDCRPEQDTHRNIMHMCVILCCSFTADVYLELSADLQPAQTRLCDLSVRQQELGSS